MQAGSWVHRGPPVETPVHPARIHPGAPPDEDNGGVDDVGDDADGPANGDADGVGGYDQVGHPDALGAGAQLAESGESRRPLGLPVLAAVP